MATKQSVTVEWVPIELELPDDCETVFGCSPDSDEPIRLVYHSDGEWKEEHNGDTCIDYAKALLAELEKTK